jgi:hypothetical protein
MASLNGSPKTYHVLPADVVEITLDTPDWSAQQFMVSKKSETVETAIGDPLIMQIYSPDAYSDTDHSPLPSQLRKQRFDPLSAPPAASNLVLTADDDFITGIIGDFNFGMYGGELPDHSFAKQVGRVYRKGPAIDPAFTEPDDSTYKMVASIDPLGSLVGHFENRAIGGGKFWFKVVTESALGISLASGHPVTTINLRPAAVSDVINHQDSNGDWLSQLVGHPRSIEMPETYSEEIWSSTDRSDTANRKRTLPIMPGKGHACLLVGTQYGADGVLKNNLYCPTDVETSAVTVDSLLATDTRFDFNMRWLGANGQCVIPTSPNLFTNIAFDGDGARGGAHNGALGRAPTGTELSTWSAALLAAYAVSLAAFIAEAKSLIEGLFNSSEYTARGRTDDQFVEDLYHAYLDRASDSIGKANWLISITDNGRPYVLNAFGIGTEFTDRMATIKAEDVLTRYAVVALQTRADTSPVSGAYDPDLSLSPVSIEWSRGTTAGTIKEIVRSYGVVILNAISADGTVNRDNVDPGCKPVADGTSQGRPGPRYTLFLSGTEYRLHANFDSDQGKKPIAIIASLGTGFPYPLKLAAKVRDDTGTLAVENITAGGDLLPSTIYAARDQIADFGAIQWGSLHARLFQNPDGVPVDIDI